VDGENSPGSPIGTDVVRSDPDEDARTRIRDTAPTRLLASAILLILLVGGGVAGCQVSPARQEAISRAWAERDAERARECRQRREAFIAGACVSGGGP
jgi:hypothetical protein